MEIAMIEGEGFGGPQKRERLEAAVREALATPEREEGKGATSRCAVCSARRHTRSIA